MSTSTLERQESGLGQQQTSQGFDFQNLGQSVPPILRGWNPLTTLGMILGFIVYWPIGLAMVFWNSATQAFGGFGWGRSRRCSNRRGHRHERDMSAPTTGNVAFEAWKQEELDRLETERQKLAAAQAEFSGFLDQLKHAKDRTEFDAFMKARSEPAAS